MLASAEAVRGNGAIELEPVADQDECAGCGRTEVADGEVEGAKQCEFDDPADT